MGVLRVVPLYQGMAGYASAARSKPGVARQALWERYVVASYWDQWGAGQHNEARIRAEIARPVEDLDGLEEVVTALSGSGVEELVRAAYARICQLLPYHEGDTAVCIAAADPQDRGLVVRLNGVSGSCVGANTMLTVHPAAAGWQGWVTYVLAHERHHSAWGYHYCYLRGGTRRDLLVSLISEGLADAFAHQMCPELRPKWIEALSPEEEERQWELIRTLLDEPDLDGELHRRTFCGDPEAGIPAFTGYTIGYHIIQAYRSTHLGEHVADWTTRDPADVLVESGYRPDHGAASG